MNDADSRRWNMFVGAAVAVLCLFSGWLALEVIELKRQVVRLEVQDVQNKAGIDRLIEAIVMPRFENKSDK